MPRRLWPGLRRAGLQPDRDELASRPGMECAILLRRSIPPNNALAAGRVAHPRTVHEQQEFRAREAAAVCGASWNTDGTKAGEDGERFKPL